MNEVKRQLNKKMGDTSQRVDKIMNQVNQKKHKNKKATNKLYYITLASFVAVLVAIMLVMNPFAPNETNTASPKLPTPDKPIATPNNEGPTNSSEEQISFLNVQTNEQEQLSVTALPFIDSLQPTTELEDFELTYEPLFTTENGELGVFHFYCGDFNCQLAFVLRDGKNITAGPTVSGSITSFKRSPNLEKVIIALRYIEPTEHGSTVERSMLQILHPVTMQTELPTSNEVYFSEFFYPVTYYDWVDDKTIQVEAANISDGDTETVLTWQGGNRPTKTIEVHVR